MTGRFISPITGNVTQSGTLLEDGGLNYVSFSGAFESAPGLYLGLTLDFLSGSYSYNRTYREEDLGNNWNAFPFDFAALERQIAFIGTGIAVDDFEFRSGNGIQNRRIDIRVGYYAAAGH